MSETTSVDPTLPGSSVQTIGGVLLAIAVVVSFLSLLRGDYMTGGSVLLYLPVGYLLFSIGRSSDRV